MIGFSQPAIHGAWDDHCKTPDIPLELMPQFGT
jgi:hypothetical protein